MLQKYSIPDGTDYGKLARCARSTVAFPAVAPHLERSGWHWLLCRAVDRRGAATRMKGHVELGFEPQIFFPMRHSRPGRPILGRILRSPSRAL